MIWKTSNGRWIERHGDWRPWFAWKPVSVEPPLECEHGQPVTRAWLCVVWRKGVLVRGRRFWLYLPFDQMDRPQQAQPAAKAAPRLRIVK
jgi:hypothetical protein